MLIICIKRHVPTASDQLWSVKRGGDGTLPGGYCSRGCDGRGERFITLVLSGQLVRENRFLRRRDGIYNIPEMVLRSKYHKNK